MSDENATQQAAVEPVVAPPTETEAPATTAEKVETPVEAKDEAPKQAEKPDEGAKSEEKPEEKPKSRARERIEELSARVRERERRIAELEAALEASRSTKAPDPDAFDDPLKYQAELTKHAVREARAEELRREAETVRKSAEEARQEAWALKVQAVKDRFPDFDRVARDPALPVTTTMAEAITESDVGPAVLYHLGQHPDEARRIAALPPVQQAREIGRLEARVSQPPPKKISSAPPPAPVLTGGGAPATTPDPENMPMDDFAKWIVKRLG
jgi:hypothetical protein